MRILAALAALTLAACACAERILLVPLDSRPAAGQFAQMIARIANVEVRFPPYGTLGRFTTPGSPDKILDWLDEQPVDDVTAVIVSTDMLAYGGLVASREPDVTAARALARLARLQSWRLRHPKTPLYAFSSTMRLAPTATAQTASWRVRLARHEELREKLTRGGTTADRVNLARIAPLIPKGVLARYRAARRRSHDVQRRLIEMAAARAFDFLIVGQDDARLFGPHVPETRDLRAYVAAKGAGERVAFVEGIDQHASVLISRALLARHGWAPKVRVVASDPLRMKRAALYESKPLETSVAESIRASGAIPTLEPGGDDYALFLNAPKPDQSAFENWLGDLTHELDQGFPVAVADVNFGADGAADPVLFATLAEKGRFAKMLSYAGWNTAGNTVGTTVPAANVYLLARRIEADPVVRETAQKEFLLHRVANDYAYHKTTRPMAYRILEDFDKIAHDETDGTQLVGITDFVRRDLKKHVRRLFEEQFLGKTFVAGNRRFAVSSLEDVQIWLPWPRVYEVRLEFHLQSRSIEP